MYALRQCFEILAIQFIILNKKNKVMVRNEKNTIKWSAHEMMVLITSACGECSDEPACTCTHDLGRAFASRINKVCKLKKTANNF